MDKVSVELTNDEYNALSFAIKARLALIESKAMAYSESPNDFRLALDSDTEYCALVSLARKFRVD
jgi:hypothetical protein